MSNSETSGGNISISFGGLLALVFITLKLTGVIAWSWWWVLSPLWLPLTIYLGILLLFAVIGGAVVGVLSFMDRYKERRRSKTSRN